MRVLVACEESQRGEVGNVLNLDCDGCRKHWLQRDAVDFGGLLYWKRNTTFTADTPQTETQTRTQNSNLTFEKDECAKEYEELGLKELKELIEADRKTENCSEIPNNCEDITEDGVTCAKYPACDDCLDNPLNKVKGSERLVKGSEQTEPTISKMEQVEPQTCSFSDCDNFKNPDYERCIECKRKQIKLKTEQTERSE